MYWFSKDDAPARVCLGAISADADTATNLIKIRDALTIDLEGGEIDFDNLNSIPDIWSAHRIFDMMLFLPPNIRSSDSVLEQYYKAVVRQWRAIMTVLSIGESAYGLRIVSTEYSTAQQPQPGVAVTPAERFMATVLGARPQKPIWEDNNVPFNPKIVRIYSIWTKNGLSPIAISSPTTFYVPAADAWKHLYGLVPWITQTVDQRGKIRYRVNEDMLEELSYAQAMALNDALKENFRLPAKVADADRAPLFSDMLKAFIDDPALTAVLNPYTPEALFEKELAYFAGEVSTCTPDGADPMLGGVDSRCYYIDPAPHLRGREQYYHYYQFFMPITKHCCNLIDNGDLEYSIDVTVERGKIQSAVVTLTKTSDGQRIERTFGQKNKIVEISMVSDISTIMLWPREEFAGWQRYYAFRYDDAPAPAPADAKRTPPRYEIEPALDNPGQTDMASSARGRLHRYYIMNQFPRYWTVKKVEKGTAKVAGYLKTRESSRVPQGPGNGVYQAAIDFGTSSTMLYRMCPGMTQPQPVLMEALWAGAVCNPERYAGDQSIPCFVPPKSAHMNIAMLQSLLGYAGHVQGQADTLQGRWGYFRSLSIEKRSTPNAEAVAVRSNLKWDPQNPTNSEHYLRQILYFIALDAKKRGFNQLQVITTYPAAMLDAQAASYIAQMNNLLVDLTNATGVQTAGTATFTESFAVANMVAAANKYGTSFCSIDIGGGTSDIYLYYRNSEDSSWQGIGSSLKVGARDIFHKQFVRDRKLIESIIPAESSSTIITHLREQFIAQNPAGTGILRFRDVLDEEIEAEDMISIVEGLLDFSVIEDGRLISVADALKDIVTMSTDTHIVNFRLRIAYYIAAICYYAGMLARGRDGMAPAPISRMTIQFAGNGSKVVNWLNGQTPLITTFIKRMFQAGAQQDVPPMAVAFSQIPKHEVALGALLTGGMLNGISEENVILAGERYAQGRESHSELSVMPLVTQDDQFRPEAHELKAFLRAFNSVINEVVPCAYDCYHYEFPENQELGFRNEVARKLRLQARNPAGMKPFFLIGAEVIEENTR